MPKNTLLKDWDVEIAEFDHIQNDALLDPMPYLEDWDEDESIYVDTGEWCQLRVWTDPFNVGVVLIKPRFETSKWWWDELEEYYVSEPLSKYLTEMLGFDTTVTRYSPDVALWRSGGYGHDS